jgi:hypothetical protein
MDPVASVCLDLMPQFAFLLPLGSAWIACMRNVSAEVLVAHRDEPVEQV